MEENIMQIDFGNQRYTVRLKNLSKDKYLSEQEILYAVTCAMNNFWINDMQRLENKARQLTEILYQAKARLPIEFSNLINLSDLSR